MLLSLTDHGHVHDFNLGGAWH